jgi:two-component system, NtrC family, C4-dicarboxylate transport response regulator DctD
MLAEQSGRGPQTESDRAAPARIRILLVENEASVREMLQQLLELLGYAVTAATNGTEAISIFKVEGADVLLTDYLMPGMNGVTLIARLQELEPGLPAILSTAYADKIATGSYRVLCKPVTARGLRAAITESLSARTGG